MIDYLFKFRETKIPWEKNAFWEGEAPSGIVGKLIVDHSNKPFKRDIF